MNDQLLEVTISPKARYSSLFERILSLRRIRYRHEDLPPFVLAHWNGRAITEEDLRFALYGNPTRGNETRLTSIDVSAARIISSDYSLPKNSRLAVFILEGRNEEIPQIQGIIEDFLPVKDALLLWVRKAGEEKLPFLKTLLSLSLPDNVRVAFRPEIEDLGFLGALGEIVLCKNPSEMHSLSLFGLQIIESENRRALQLWLDEEKRPYLDLNDTQLKDGANILLDELCNFFLYGAPRSADTQMLTQMLRERRGAGESSDSLPTLRLFVTSTTPSEVGRRPVPRWTQRLFYPKIRLWFLDAATPGIRNIPLVEEEEIVLFLPEDAVFEESVFAQIITLFRQSRGVDVVEGSFFLSGTLSPGLPQSLDGRAFTRSAFTRLQGLLTEEQERLIQSLNRTSFQTSFALPPIDERLLEVPEVAKKIDLALRLDPWAQDAIFYKTKALAHAGFQDAVDTALLNPQYSPRLREKIEKLRRTRKENSASGPDIGQRKDPKAHLLLI